MEAIQLAKGSSVPGRRPVFTDTRHSINETKQPSVSDLAIITHRDSDARLHGDPVFGLCLRRTLFSTGFLFAPLVSFLEARCQSGPVGEVSYNWSITDPRNHGILSR
jgi:hypothetical protein